MHLTDESHQNETQPIEGQCEVWPGTDRYRQCERSAHATGPHTYTIFSHPFLFREDDPTQPDIHHCCTCFELITDENRAEGVGSRKYCKLHDGPCKAEYHARNGCPSCGYDGPHDVRNYSMMWGDGDIHCGRCGTYVRMFDSG